MGRLCRQPASEILGLMMVLFLRGVESTAGLTEMLFKRLAENPDQRELLRADPSLIADAVEEAIRSPPRCSSSGARPHARSPCTASRSRPAAGSSWSKGREP